MSTNVFKYWVFQNNLISVIEDWRRIPEPLPEGWAVYDSPALLEGDPAEYSLENGTLMRAAPPPPPNALQRAMSTDPNVLKALEGMKQTNPIAAILVQLSIAHLEQNLGLAESALTELSSELSKGRNSSPTPVPTPSPAPAPSPSPTSTIGVNTSTKATK